MKLNVLEKKMKNSQYIKLISINKLLELNQIIEKVKYEIYPDSVMNVDDIIEIFIYRKNYDEADYKKVFTYDKEKIEKELKKIMSNEVEKIMNSKPKRCLKADRTDDQKRRFYYWNDHITRFNNYCKKRGVYSNTGNPYPTEEKNEV